METRLTKLSAGVVLAGLLAGAALTAEAADEFAIPELVVEYGDLDLASAQGVQALHRRLMSAAERVCPRTDGRISAPDKAAARECRKQALDRAVRAIGSPELATLHTTTAPRS